LETVIAKSSERPFVQQDVLGDQRSGQKKGSRGEGVEKTLTRSGEKKNRLSSPNIERMRNPTQERGRTASEKATVFKAAAVRRLPYPKSMEDGVKHFRITSKSKHQQGDSVSGGGLRRSIVMIIIFKVFRSWGRRGRGGVGVAVVERKMGSFSWHQVRTKV